MRKMLKGEKRKMVRGESKQMLHTQQAQTGSVEARPWDTEKSEDQPTRQRKCRRAEIIAACV
jgi:hypothetical protein